MLAVVFRSKKNSMMIVFSSLLIGGASLNQENIRGRMLKGLTNIRDSTEKLTYRFMKKK